ncbi:MAG: tetratricopeptide repeat protein [Chloroflexi bacterium]|nr:tetratricopeptide repeat protein [Chloroflexota bacterium]
MARLSLSFLGTFQATLDNRPITTFESNKVRALLAYLAVESDRPHSRDALAGLFWSDFSNRDALNNLRYALSNLREAIGDRHANPPFLRITRDAIQFNPSSAFILDVRAWQSVDTHTPISNLQSLISTYRGIFLEGFSCDSAPFEEWVTLTRERITRRVLDALCTLIKHFEEQGKYDRVETYARKHIESEPWDEQAHQALMRALAQSGQRSAALAQYDKCRRALKQELDVAPSRETTQLYEQIRDGTFARRTPNNVPISLTSFVGRKHEMNEVRQLLETTRLLTLTGAGGCGKTRLAMQVVQDLSGLKFPDGIWWVDLAPLKDATLVPQTIAATFDLQEIPNQSLTATLANYFHAKELLLILNNCEHLIDACAQVVGVLLSACPKLHFLATSREPLNVSGESVWRVPSLKCPATPMPLEQLRQYDAIQLFTERARAVVPRWLLVENKMAVTEICIRLDGIPLALELAAARVKTLSADQIAARLQARFDLLTDGNRTALPRHQSLRAAMDWSYDLLSEAEKKILARSGVFLGGFTLPAIQAICGIPDDAISILDQLTLLIDKSLTQRLEADGDEQRFAMLETVRQYAAEKLNASAEAQITRRKHLEYYAIVAEENEPRMWGSDMPSASALLEKESGNFSVALEWGLSSEGPDEIEIGARLAGALWIYWNGRGHLTEGRQWLERAVLKMRKPGQVRAKVLTSAAWLIWQQGDYALARTRIEESILLWRATGPAGKLGLAEALHMSGHLSFDQRQYEQARAAYEESLALYHDLQNEEISYTLVSDLGMVAYHQHDYATARARFESSLEFYRQRGNQGYINENLNRLGDLARLDGDYARAENYYATSLECARQLQDPLMSAANLHKLGRVAQYRMDYALAQKYLAESLKLQTESGNKQGIAECLAGFAGLSVGMKEFVRSGRLFGAAQALLDSIGAPLAPADVAEWKRDEAIARTQFNRETFNAAWEEGQKMTLEQAIEYALENTRKIGGNR